MSTEVAPASPRRSAPEKEGISTTNNKGIPIECFFFVLNLHLAVLAFLEKLNLETYIDNFAKNDIDIDTLKELDDARLTRTLT